MAATSATNVWAVGSTSDSSSTSKTLIERWDGASWKQLSSPSPGSVSNGLGGVAATSATSAWAVGRTSDSRTNRSRTLIERWNGSSWQQQSSLNPSSHSDQLNGVAAISATDAWAVGSNFSGTTHKDQTLILRWDGSSWKQVSSPNPNPSTGPNRLNGVAAISATDAWAVGLSTGLNGSVALILHWNGSSWKQVPASPSDGDTSLSGVTATSATSAWAVGTSCIDCGSDTQDIVAVIEHWNGTTWTQQTSPSTGNGLGGVAATSATSAWAVGNSGNGADPLIAHWNGSSWKQETTPTPGPGPLSGVAATSATNAWAVGNDALHGC